ncbi:hypothetical protein EV401DRAFT_1958927, partial [Pisolithus croceorrhizus]
SSRGSVRILWWFGEGGLVDGLTRNRNRKASITSKTARLCVANRLHCSCSSCDLLGSASRLRRNPLVNR